MISAANGASIVGGYAFRRVRHRPLEFFTSVAGLASAAAALVVLMCLPTITAEQTLRSALSDLSAERRSVTAVVAGERILSADIIRATDEKLRRRLSGTGLGPLRHLVSYRALAADDGAVFRLGGAADLASAVRVVTGRAPRRCDASRCAVVEVVEVVDSSTSETPPFAPWTPIPELAVVGRAVRIDPTVFTAELGPEPGEALLVADGTEGVDTLSSLQLIRRIHAWVAPLELNGFRRAQAKELLAQLADASGDVDQAGFAVSAPDDAINEAIDRSRTAARALALPRGTFVALLMVAVVLVGIGRRTSLQRDADRLHHRGARRLTVTAFAAFDAAYVVVAALVGGLLLAGGVVWGLARRAQLGVTSVVRSDLLARGTVLGLAAVIVWVVLTSVLLARDRGSDGRRFRPTDLAGLAAAGVLALLLSRGALDASTLGASSGVGADAALWAIPALLAVVYSSICARIIPVIGRRSGTLLARRHRLEGAAVREALGKPLAPLALAAAVVLAVSVACFGLTFRSTLHRSAEDQASFVVPYDARLSVSSTLVRPNAVRPSAGWGSVGADGGARTTWTDVLRRSVSVYRSGADSEVVDLLALDPQTLGALRPWRADYGPSSSTLATSLAAPSPEPVGSVLPSGARAVQIDIAGRAATTGITTIVLSVIIERANGTWHEEVAEWVSDSQAVAGLGEDDEGSRLVGFRVAQPPETAKRQEHHAGEGNGTAVDATGVTFDIMRVTALSQPTDRTSTSDSRNPYARWPIIARVPLHPRQMESAVADLRVLPDNGLRIRVELQGTAALIVPRVARPEISVLVDPLTASAADGGTLIVETLGQSFELRVVAVAKRFPTMGDRFVIADIDALAQRFNLVQPTYGTPTEVWLGAHPGGVASLQSALRDHRFDAIGIDSRSDRLRHLQHDPVGQAADGVLAAAVLLGALLAAFAVAINVHRERIDDAPFHRALLLDGAGHGRVRRLLWVRSAWVVGVGVPLGLLGGLVLARLALAAVSLSATAAEPIPPLLLQLPAAAISVALFVFIVGLVGVAVAMARTTRFATGQDLLRGSS